VDGFAFLHHEMSRFGDLDPMGHVNNAVYLAWIESARIEFLRSLGLFDQPDPAGMAMILARVEVDFRSPVGFGEEIEVGVRVARVGNKSFQLEYELHADGRLAAEARTVLVAFDYDSREPTRVPEAWREALGEKVPA
jgi:acyl-CoA thioester hydrolase